MGAHRPFRRTGVVPIPFGISGVDPLPYVSFRGAPLSHSVLHRLLPAIPGYRAVSAPWVGVQSSDYYHYLLVRPGWVRS